MGKLIIIEGLDGCGKSSQTALLEKYFEGRNQLTIDSLLGNAMSREDMIEESYKLANREIGYRLEKLKYD